jgi:hypothetical protein
MLPLFPAAFLRVLVMIILSFFRKLILRPAFCDIHLWVMAYINEVVAAYIAKRNVRRTFFFL